MSETPRRLRVGVARADSELMGTDVVLIGMVTAVRSGTGAELIGTGRVRR